MKASSESGLCAMLISRTAVLLELVMKNFLCGDANGAASAGQD
jgi:hypothetical protein